MKKKALKPNRNNIEAALPVFKGFYGSYWDDHDFYGEAEHFGLPEKFPFWDYVNYGDYYSNLSSQFCDIVETEMSDFIESIEYQRLVSPKEYNFTNDSIYCIIRPKVPAITKYIYDNKADFEKYLVDHLKSRDGFMSFHSYHFADWEISTKSFTRFDAKYDSKGFNLGFVLDFIAENEKITQESFYYDAEDCISNFYNEEFSTIVTLLDGVKEEGFVKLDHLMSVLEGYKPQVPSLSAKILEIKEFVQHNYTKQNMYQRAMDKFNNEDDEENEFINIDAIIGAVVGKIESQTLSIEFPVEKKKK